MMFRWNLILLGENTITLRHAAKKFMEAEELVSKKQKEYLDTLSTARLMTGREKATAILSSVGGVGLSVAAAYFFVNG